MLVSRLLGLLLLTLRAEAGVKLPPFLRAQNYSDNLVPVNTTSNPCTDFYGYSCSTWITRSKRPPYEPTWSPWIAVSHEIKHRLSKILSRHDPTLTKAQIFYRSCLTDNDANKYLNELTSLVDDLGGWPLIDNEANTNDWLRHISKVTRALGTHPILKIHADLDYKDPKRFMIYVEPGNLIFPQHVLTSSGYNTELEAYEQWILGTAKHMYNKSHVDEDVVKEIVKFEMHLAKLMENKPKNERTTVLKLSKKFSTDWSRVFDLIFKGFAKITPNTVITIRNNDYLKNLFLLIDKKGRRVANDYITWAVIKDLSRDTTPHMRNLNFLIDQAVLGVQDDLSREHECLNKIIEYFSPSLVPQYLNSYVNPKVFPKVTAMVASIKTAFIETLLRSDWLSKEAKLLSVEKVKNVKLYLGYSKWHLTGAPLRLYHKLEMTDDHFMNVIKLRYFKTTQELFRLAEKQPRTRWPSTPFEVNAFYSILQNSIFIPLGLLEPPFFHLFGDDTLNYGALGSLIGHELSHSLDPAGILADPTGKITKWWPDRDLDLYKNRIRCFTGANTLAEMISDSNGLRISVTAVKKVAPREKLRRFFMSFAQMWCETSGNTDIFNGGEHPPVWDRVQSLSNNQDFRRAYNCGSAQSCQLW